MTMTHLWLLLAAALRLGFVLREHRNQAKTRALMDRARWGTTLSDDPSGGVYDASH